MRALTGGSSQGTAKIGWLVAVIVITHFAGQKAQNDAVLRVREISIAGRPCGVA